MSGEGWVGALLGMRRDDDLRVFVGCEEVDVMPFLMSALAYWELWCWCLGGYGISCALWGFYVSLAKRGDILLLHCMHASFAVDIA